MTQRNVEQLLGRLLTDPALQRRFAASPARCLTEPPLVEIELSDVEREAIAVTDLALLFALAERIDPRLRRIDSAAVDTSIDATRG